MDSKTTLRAPPLNGHQLDLMEKARPLQEDEEDSKRSLRVAIVTENFLPKIDGVTRTLAMLLEHLQKEGHEALVLGPDSGMTSYAGHEVVGTKGIPLLGVYKGLKLNFIRPAFIRKLQAFQPDVIQFVDPIWLCAQCIPIVQYYFPLTPLLTSYHTNLAMYATLFGFSWLTPTMWNLQRNLHSRCRLTYCPSPSTARMLISQGFQNVRLWPRGVDTNLFRPEARDYDLRRSWSAEPNLLEGRPSPQLLPTNSLSNRLPSPRLLPLLDSGRKSSLDIPELGLSNYNYNPLNNNNNNHNNHNNHNHNNHNHNNGNDNDLAGGHQTPFSNSAAPAPPKIDPESKIVILYVGRISWEKNLRLLVEAFRGLEKPSSSLINGDHDDKRRRRRRHRPACQLVFVGDGPSKNELEQLCIQYNLKAIFMGYKKGQELAAAYASADIFAFPSWTETFGQVVLESLASGLPVVGLRAEGVCDLVKDQQTGLLLDLDCLIPQTTTAQMKETCHPSTDSSSSSSSSSSPPPMYSDFKPLPTNPHALVNHSSPTFPLAVSMYRNLLEQLATDHERRRRMSQAATMDASSRSWHGAMEMLVDGYREISHRSTPPPPTSPPPSPVGGLVVVDEKHHDNNNNHNKEKSLLSLSRTSTIELDIVSHSPELEQGGGESLQYSTYAETTAAASSLITTNTNEINNKRRRRLLGGVFKRSGGRNKEGSISIPPLRTWLREVRSKDTLIHKLNDQTQSHHHQQQQHQNNLISFKRSTSSFLTSSSSSSSNNPIWSNTRWMIKLALVSYIIYVIWMMLFNSVRFNSVVATTTHNSSPTSSSSSSNWPLMTVSNQDRFKKWVNQLFIHSSS